MYRSFRSSRNRTAQINASARSSERRKLVERSNQVTIPSSDHRVLHPPLNFVLVTQLYDRISRAKKDEISIILRCRTISARSVMEIRGLFSQQKLNPRLSAEREMGRLKNQWMLSLEPDRTSCGETRLPNVSLSVSFS